MTSIAGTPVNQGCETPAIECVGHVEEIWVDGGQTKTLLFDNPEQGGWFQIALRALTDAVKAVEDGNALAYCITWAPGYQAEYLRRIGASEGWVRA